MADVQSRREERRRQLEMRSMVRAVLRVDVLDLRGDTGDCDVLCMMANDHCFRIILHPMPSTNSNSWTIVEALSLQS